MSRPARNQRVKNVEVQHDEFLQNKKKKKNQKTSEKTPEEKHVASAVKGRMPLIQPSFISVPPTKIELQKWKNNKAINPRTNRKIKKNGYVYNLLASCLTKKHVVNEEKKDSKDEKKIVAVPEAVIKPVDLISAKLGVAVTGLDSLLYGFKCDDIKSTDTIFHDLEFGTETQEYVKLRKQRVDPLTLEPAGDDAFEFHFRWNPYNGERKDIDRDGPLCFNPDNLIHYFYVNRCRFLWHEEVRDNNGVIFQPYYDLGVGNGPKFNVPGRGEHPEWYLFRLPIVNCYTPANHNPQVVTIGPMLTKSEIKIIYKLACRTRPRYREMFGTDRPNLIKLFTLYEGSVNPNPELIIRGDASHVDMQQLKYQANCRWVNELVKFK